MFHPFIGWASVTGQMYNLLTYHMCIERSHTGHSSGTERGSPVLKLEANLLYRVLTQKSGEAIRSDGCEDRVMHLGNY